MTRLRWKTHFIAFFVSGLFIVPSMWLVLDREPPVIVEDAAYIGPWPITPGESFYIRYSVNRKKLCPYTIQPLIFDGASVRYVLEQQNILAAGPLGPDIYEVERTVPEGAAHGWARYSTVLEFYCNPIQRYWPVQMVTPTVRFKVERPEK